MIPDNDARLETETAQNINFSFIDVKMNVIMIQPSLSSQRLTGYWQEQAAGIYKKFYLSSQAWSLAWVYCEMPAESWAQAFNFHKIVTIDTWREDF